MEPLSTPPPTLRLSDFGDADYRAQAAFRSELETFLRLIQKNALAGGLTYKQHLLLLLIRGDPSYPRVGVRAIAAGLAIDTHRAGILIGHAVRSGLLQRHRSRHPVVSLTVQGQEALDRITAANRQQLDALRAALEAVYRVSAP